VAGDPAALEQSVDAGEYEGPDPCPAGEVNPGEE
jgi:hypothetical protein